MPMHTSLRVEKRIELLYSILIFTSWRNLGICSDAHCYKDHMLNYFKPYSNHKAVRSCEKLIKSGFAFDATHGLMMHLSEPPELEVIVPLSKYVIKRAGGIAAIMEFVNALRIFYLDSNFEEFWNSHLQFYRRVEENARKYIKLEEIVRVLEEYFGLKKKEYHVVLLLLSKYSYGYEIDNSITYAFISPTRIGSSGVPEYKSWDPVLHELSHSFINPITEEFSSDFKNPEALLRPVKDKVKRVWDELLGSLSKELVEEAYKDWKSYINEHLVEAVKLKIAEQLGFMDPHKLRRAFSYYESRGFIYMKLVYNLLSRYDRSKYASFRDFYPEIVSTLNNLTCNLNNR